MGIIAAETIAGAETMALDYVMMPRATFCQPQIASFGWTEAQAREQGFDVKVAKFPFTANGKAHGLGDTVGFVKLISDDKHGELLGAHLIGPDVTELLPELTLAQQVGPHDQGARPQRARPPDPERGGQGGPARPRRPHDQLLTAPCDGTMERSHAGKGPPQLIEVDGVGTDRARRVVRVEPAVEQPEQRLRRQAQRPAAGAIASVAEQASRRPGLSSTKARRGR